MPWARGFCPFRACGAKVGIVLFLPFTFPFGRWPLVQGVWGKSRNCLISALLERAASWSFWAFSPYLSHMRKFSKAKVMRCFCRRETFLVYSSLLAMPIAHSGISFTYSLNILPSVILKRSWASTPSFELSYTYVRSAYWDAISQLMMDLAYLEII